MRITCWSIAYYLKGSPRWQPLVAQSQDEGGSLPSKGAAALGMLFGK